MDKRRQNYDLDNTLKGDMDSRFLSISWRNGFMLTMKGDTKIWVDLQRTATMHYGGNYIAAQERYGLV